MLRSLETGPDAAVDGHRTRLVVIVVIAGLRHRPDRRHRPHWVGVTQPPRFFRPTNPLATTAPVATAPVTTAPGGPPAPTDIAAARACAAFTTYLDDASQGKVPAAVGQALTNDAYKLIAGAAQAQTAGQPLPKWTNLGEYLLAAADDVVNRDTSARSTDGAAAAKACQTIPGPARGAGGYTSTASPTTTSPSTHL